MSRDSRLVTPFGGDDGGHTVAAAVDLVTSERAVHVFGSTRQISSSGETSSARLCGQLPRQDAAAAVAPPPPPPNGKHAKSPCRPRLTTRISVFRRSSFPFGDVDARRM